MSGFLCYTTEPSALAANDDATVTLSADTWEQLAAIVGAALRLWFTDSGDPIVFLPSDILAYVVPCPTPDDDAAMLAVLRRGDQFLPLYRAALSAWTDVRCDDELRHALGFSSARVVE